MDHHRRIGPERPTIQEVLALESTVRVMRRAQGKKNPEDLPIGSPAWDAVSAEFMLDMYKAMDGDPGELKRINL